jgi:hypothetical protein
LLDDAKQQPGVTQNAGLPRPKPLKTLERVKGIEPSSSAWKAVALPLSYTRKVLIDQHFSHFVNSDLVVIESLAICDALSAG